VDHNQNCVPFGSNTDMRYSPFPIQILLIWKQELVYKLCNHMLFLPPSFSSNHQPASLSNSLLCHQHKHLTDLHLVTIKIQSELHGDLLIITLKSGKEFKPPSVSEPLSHLRIGFKNFGTLWFYSDYLSGPLWCHQKKIL
jgi:hypothetical protein